MKFWGKILFLYLITFSAKNFFNQIFPALLSTLTDVDWSLAKKMSKIDTWQTINISSTGQFSSPDSVPSFIAWCQSFEIQTTSYGSSWKQGFSQSLPPAPPAVFNHLTIPQKTESQQAKEI